MNQTHILTESISINLQIISTHYHLINIIHVSEQKKNFKEHNIQHKVACNAWMFIFQLLKHNVIYCNNYQSVPLFHKRNQPNH